MLDFYLGTGGIENPSKHLGEIDEKGIYWLQKNGLLNESLPYYDDTVLSLAQVQQLYDTFKVKVSLNTLQRPHHLSHSAQRQNP